MIGKRQLGFAVSIALMGATVGCGGGGGGVSNSIGLSRVRVDSGRSARATIDPAGGAISATGSNGAIYTLTIPSGAVTEPTEITLYPLSSIEQLPYAGGLAAGFHMTPEGMSFAVPATLTVKLSSNPTSSLSGFGYEGDAQDLHDYAMKANGDTLTFSIYHFSGGGAGMGNGSLPVPSSARGRAEQQIAVLLNNRNQAPQAIDLANILTTWYNATIKPGLTTLATDLNPLATLDEYRAWLTYVEAGPWPAPLQLQIYQGMSSRVNEAAQLAADGLRSLISRTNQQCAANNDLTKAKQILRYQQRAELLHLDTPNSQLTRQDVLNGLCVQVKITHLTFPATLQASESGTLQFRVGYQIGNNAIKYDQPMAVTVIPNFATDNTERHGTVNDGQHTAFGGSWTRASADNPLRLHIFAHFSLSELAAITKDQYLEAGGSSGLPDVMLFDGTGTYHQDPDNGAVWLPYHANWELDKLSNGLYSLKGWSFISDGSRYPFPYITANDLNGGTQGFDGFTSDAGSEAKSGFRLHIEMSIGASNARHIVGTAVKVFNYDDGSSVTATYSFTGDVMQ